MFRNAKVGERVFGIVKGWGSIIDIYTNKVRLIKVKFDSGYIDSFLIDGKSFIGDLVPSLFWDEVEIEIPEKPIDLEYEYRKLQEREFVPKIINYEIVYNPKSRLWSAQGRQWTRSMLVKYFDRGQTMNNFIHLLNERKIQPEELERVIRKVEREEQE